MEGVIQAILGAGIGITAFLVGWPWQIIFVYLVLWIIDIITGCLKAGKTGEWSSSKMKQGLIKKTGEIIVILVVLILQTTLTILCIPIPAASILIGAIIMKEIGSIFENLLIIDNNLIPASIKKYLKVAQDFLDSKIDDDKK